MPHTGGVCGIIFGNEGYIIISQKRIAPIAIYVHIGFNSERSRERLYKKAFREDVNLSLRP